MIVFWCRVCNMECNYLFYDYRFFFYKILLLVFLVYMLGNSLIQPPRWFRRLDVQSGLEYVRQGQEVRDCTFRPSSIPIDSHHITAYVLAGGQRRLLRVLYVTSSSHSVNRRLRIAKK